MEFPGWDLVPNYPGNLVPNIDSSATAAFFINNIGYQKYLVPDHIIKNKTRFTFVIDTIF